MYITQCYSMFCKSMMHSSVPSFHVFLCLLRGAVDLDGRIEPGDMLLQVCEPFPPLLI